tara:strand:- start:88 stop:432 length:345 start_codon:yes stop_codon:yes gene_type:complete
MRAIDKMFLGVFCTLFVMMVVLMLVVGGMERSFQSMTEHVEELLERPPTLPSPQYFLPAEGEPHMNPHYAGFFREYDDGEIHPHRQALMLLLSHLASQGGYKRVEGAKNLPKSP